MNRQGKSLTDWDDEIHTALAHPIRRRILECLQERSNLSFNELLKCVVIPNHGKLGFHLRALEGLVEQEPSANKYRLTHRGQLAVELICDTRFLIERRGRELAFEPTRYVRRLRLGDHAVLFYDTEDFKREISFPFLLAGLLKGEAVVYLVSEHELDSKRREILGYGISVDHFQKKAFTIMSADEWYLEKGKTQAKTIIANWLKFVKEKRKAGFLGLRAATEMEVFFNNAKSKELFRYEAALGRQLTSNLCGLCLYDKHRLDGEQFNKLNNSHGHSIIKGIAVKTRGQD